MGKNDRRMGQALSTRELEVFEEYGRTGRYEAVAETLKINQTTVASHLKHAYQKLGVKSAIQAAFVLWHDR
jgi:DNA-binding NarL/FixJ family response regulator